MRQFLQRSARRFPIAICGATAIEYALIAAGIALMIVTAVNGVGTRVSGLFTSVSSSLN
jgi:pilus assembly protein Flp/PilA